MPDEVAPPIVAPPEGMLFTLRDITYSPDRPMMKEPFTVGGKVELFKIPFVAPVWVIVTVEYPEAFWEEIIPIIGAPQVREMATAIGGDFEVTFKQGFEREGEFKLTTRLYAGPTLPINKVTLPPFPPVFTEETTFMVAGELPPEEVIGFRNLEIVSYAKNGEPAVTAPDVLELEVGDRCRVNIAYEHKGDATSKVLYSSIGDIKPVIGFDEVIANKKTVTVPKTEDWEPFEAYVDIPITTAISPGDYDLYAKIDTLISPFLEDRIKIVGVPVKGEVRNVQIIDYDTSVKVGDTCHVKVEFEYQGPATSQRVYSSIGDIKPVIGFDEVIKASKSISVPETPAWETYGAELDMAVTGIAPGTYDLYAKVDNVISPYLEDVITVEEVAPPVPPPPPAVPEFMNLTIISYDGSLPIGGTCRVKVRFQYKGPMTGADLYAAIGNYGVWGFDEVLPAVASIVVAEAGSWQWREATVNIYISSAISPGTYDLYAKIGTLISPYYENVIKITEVTPPVEEYTLTVAISPTGAGYVTKSPDRPTYSPGERVTLTAYANPGYYFDYWAGIAGTPSGTTVSITMNADYRVMAMFREIAVWKGIFNLYPVNEPISYEEWCVGWIAEGVEYISKWAPAGGRVTVEGPYGEPVPLKGKLMAYLWPGYGEAKKYGPTTTLVFADGYTFDFDIKNLKVTGYW